MSQFFESLDREWERIARSADAARALERWERIDPVLASPSLDVLLARRRCSAADGEIVLRALAGLAPGDRLAARTMLQALVPGLGALARRIGGGRADLASELAALAWERIRTYPRSRHGSVGANILLDVRKGYAASLRPPRSDVCTVASELSDHMWVRDSVEGEVIVDEDLRPELLSRILASGERGLISDDVLRAIVRTRLHGESIEEVAAQECVSARALRHRRWRGERVLRECLGHLPLAG